MLSLAAIRRVPALSALPRRCYTSSAKEGSVAQSKGFRCVELYPIVSPGLNFFNSKKEQAQESELILDKQ